MQRISLILFLWLIAASAHATTIALDATAACTNSSGSGTTMTCAYHSTSNNDVILVFAGCGSNTTVPTVSTVGDGTNSFTQRATELNGSGHFRLDEWYFVASGNYNKTVTVTWSSSCPDPVVIVKGVVNVNATPWDANASLPKLNTATSTTPTATGISTTSTNTMLIAVAGTEAASYLSIPSPSGFSTIGSTLNVGGCCLGSHHSDEEIVGAVQSSITVTYGTAGSASWAIIVDALADASQPAATTGRLMFKSGPGW